MQQVNNHAQPEQLTFSEILFLDAGAGSTEENTNRHALSLSLTSGKIRAEKDQITSHQSHRDPAAWPRKFVMLPWPPR
jgi:hypothetical protein